MPPKHGNSIKVAIIGAGASGISAAEVLMNPKYRNLFDVTIYEKENYVGGKCCTIRYDGSVCDADTGGSAFENKYAPENRGYEVGASVFPENSSVYSDFEFLLKKSRLTSGYLKDPTRDFFSNIAVKDHSIFANFYKKSRI